MAALSALLVPILALAAAQSPSLEEALDQAEAQLRERELEDARASFEALLPLPESDAARDHGWRVWEGLAVCAILEGRMAEADRCEGELLARPAPLVYHLRAHGRSGDRAVRDGRLGDARGHFESLLEKADEEEFGAFVVGAKMGLAAIAFESADYVETARLLEELLPPADEPALLQRRADVLLRIGQLHLDLEEDERTVVACEEALAAFEELGDAAGVAHATLELAWCRIRADDPEGARNWLERGREAVAVGAGLQGRWWVRWAQQAAQRGELDEAGEAARSAIESYRSVEHPLLGEAHANGVLAEVALLRGDLPAMRHALDAAFEVHDRFNASTASATERAAVHSHFPALAALEQEWAARAVHAARGTSGHRDAMEQLVRVGARWKGFGFEPEEVEEDLRSSRSLADLEWTAASTNSAFVEFFLGHERTYALLVGPRITRLVACGSTAEVEAAATEFVEVLRAPPVPGRVAQLARAGLALTELAVEPWLPWATTAQELRLAPDGVLDAVPFAAVVLEAPEQPRRFAELEFLLDRVAVTRVTALREVSRASGTPRSPWEGTALLLGDPTLNGEPAEEATRGSLLSEPPSRWPALPGTREEVEQLERRLREREQSVRLACGDDASPRVLESVDGTVSLLHLATHAWSDPRFPRRTGLVLAPGDAGAFFSADRVRALPLDGGLVVLSACETARGRWLPALGSRSLARSFLAAGADTVVASLWPLHDARTASFMDAYYATLEECDGDAAFALHRLQRAMRYEAVLDAREAPPSAGADAARGAPPEGGERLGAAKSAAAEERRGDPAAWASFVTLRDVTPIRRR